MRSRSSATWSVARRPLCVVFGTHAYEVTQQVYAERLKGWTEWAELSAEADGPDRPFTAG